MLKLDRQKFDNRLRDFKSIVGKSVINCVGVNKDTFFFFSLLHSLAQTNKFQFRFCDDEYSTKNDVVEYFKSLGGSDAFVKYVSSCTVDQLHTLDKSIDLFSPKNNVYVLCSDARRRQSYSSLTNDRDCSENVFTWREFLVFMTHVDGVTFIPRLDFTVTYECSLNCSYCNMFVPNAKHRKISCTRILSDLVKLFDILQINNIRIGILHFVGGEPLLNNQIFEMITLAIASPHVSLVWCTTNGTISKNLNLFREIKSEKFWVFLTNYTESLPMLTKKTNKVIDTLKNIFNNRIIVSAEKYWIDFGHPSIKYDGTSTDYFRHFSKCTAEYRGYNDYKFYYCNLSLAANEIGLLDPSTSDYLDLRRVSTKDLLAYDLGYLDHSYPVLCETCAGCNTGIETVVTPESQGVIKLREIR